MAEKGMKKWQVKECTDTRGNEGRDQGGERGERRRMALYSNDSCSRIPECFEGPRERLSVPCAQDSLIVSPSSLTEYRGKSRAAHSKLYRYTAIASLFDSINYRIVVVAPFNINAPSYIPWINLLD